MQVKAKFKCVSVTDTGSQKTVKLQPVTTGSEENQSFAKYTPSGELWMNIDNETPASEAFSPTKEYYLTFDEA